MLMVLTYFLLIGDGAHEEGETNIITNSFKIGFREVNVGSTHTFCTHTCNIKNPSNL